MAYTMEEAGGFLQLHCFKSRFSPERVIRLRADFASGEFELAEAGEDVEEADEVELVRDFIGKNPGTTQRHICEVVQSQGIPRSRALAILRSESRRLWRTERGQFHSIRYFLLSSVPSVPPLQGREHRNTHLSACSASVPGKPENADEQADHEDRGKKRAVFREHRVPDQTLEHGTDLRTGGRMPDRLTVVRL